MKTKQRSIILLTLAGLIFAVMVLFNACAEDPAILPSSVSTESEKPIDVAPLLSDVPNLAKALAFDLNNNEIHRREVFSKMANRFDGDKNMLLTHLSNEVTTEVQQTIKSSTLKSKLAKGGVSYREVDVVSIAAKYPKLQLMMPFLEKWSDEKITAAGGLVVAYYPFGMDDRKVKEITGYNKNGLEVKITRETAPNIPYVLINMNERTDDMGYLKADPKKQSQQGGNPKYFEVSTRADWKQVGLTELQTVKAVMQRSATSSESFFKKVKVGAGFATTSEGGGGTPPPPPPTVPGFRLRAFMGYNLSQFEGWLESDCEIEITIKQMDVSVLGYPISAATFMTNGAFAYDMDGGYFYPIYTYARWDSRAHFTPYPGFTVWNDAFRVYVIEDDGSSYWDDPIGDKTFYKDTHPWGSLWPVVDNVAYLILDSGNYAI